MPNIRLLNAIKLAAVAIVVATVYFPWKTDASQVITPGTARTEIAGFGSSMEQRLGQDDGAAFVIHFMGDAHGSLETCGCKAKLSGGLARREGYTEAFAQRFKDVPELLVDSGGFLSDVRTEHGMLISYAITQDEWMLKAYDKFKVDVANLSDHDFTFVSSLATGAAGEEGENGADFPVVDRMISANASSETGIRTAVKPYIIKDVPARQPGSTQPKKVRIAFIGLCDAVGAEAAPVKGVRVLDPVTTARSTLATVRNKADVVVVLAHVKTQMALRIAKEVQGIDLVIAGNGEVFTSPVRIGATLVAFAPYEAQMIGEVRFYPSDKGGFSVKERYIGIDTGIPESAEAKEFVDVSHKAISARFRPMLKAENSTEGAGTVPDHGGSADKFAGYVSAQACSKCHAEQYHSWVKSGHGQAMTSLATKISVMDNRCLVCHTTGYTKGLASNSPRSIALLNVQCEQCHGPGREHVAKPDKSYGHVAETASSCNTCHTSQTSPEFNLGAYLAKMKH
jgi:2',3'-cyclic-nucleotide 2'-phosphodiesterase (5'-nucleotidase family)